ncbi:JAB1/Mov34/MPN/PAD-1 ubiquitin protease-domain-containing protein, partial [Jimgerdemannia flammicorona]
MDADNARKTWELQNNIVTVDPADQVYLYDKEAHNREVNGKPWAKDPHYFTKVKISAVALIKMVMHARSGGVNEVMGYMQGKIQGDTMIVMDSFALPVEGTETRVNAMNEANEYSVNHTETCKQVREVGSFWGVGRLENVLGWYHSHPGYGCWLSGIDCSTQLLMQQFQEPFVAVV